MHATLLWRIRGSQTTTHLDCVCDDVPNVNAYTLCIVLWSFVHMCVRVCVRVCVCVCVCVCALFGYI